MNDVFKIIKKVFRNVEAAASIEYALLAALVSLALAATLIQLERNMSNTYKTIAVRLGGGGNFETQKDSPDDIHPPNETPQHNIPAPAPPIGQ